MKYQLIDLNKEFTIEKIATLFYMEYEKDYAFAGEKHDFWEFVYCDHGHIIISMDEEVHILKKGDIAFHQPNEFHTLKADSITSPNIIVASFQCKNPALYILARKHFPLNDNEHSILSRILCEADNTFCIRRNPSEIYLESKENNYFAGQQCILNLLELFLIDIIRRLQKETNVSLLSINAQKPPASSTNGHLVTSVMDFFSLNIQNSLSAEEICRHFFVSKSHLDHAFYKAKGKSFMKVFADMKIEQAKILLRNSTYSITEVSEILGYNSVHYFSKRFKLATTMSPTEYISSIKMQLEMLK